MPGSQRYQLTPPESSLDLGENHWLEADRDGLEKAMELLGVRVLVFFGTTFGNSVSEHGLYAMTLSRTARLKIPCSITWYLTVLRADKPSPIALVTHAWTVDGRMSAIGMSPKYGRKWRFRFAR